MLRFVRAMALAIAGFGAAAGWIALAEAQQIPAQAHPSRKPAKGKAASDDANAAPVDAEASLDKARRALAEGKPETAFALADAVVRNAKKDSRNTARALAVRGEAHLRQGRPAEALADLESALWVKGGLAGAEREAATTARAQARQQSGLAASAARGTSHQAADAGDAAARRSGDGGSERAGAVALPSAPAASSSGLGGFFSSIFGGGSKGQSDAERTGRPPATTATAVPPRPTEPAVSSWEPQRVEDATRKPSAAAPAKPARAATAVAAPKASAPSAAGPYRIMLAAVRSRSEAEAMAQAVRKDEAAALGSRSFEIIEETYGNMGRFYRVRIGMFGHPTEALAVCSTLRQKRIDCMMLDH